MKKLAPMGSAAFLGAASLLALGLFGVGSCTADVPASSPGQGVVALFNPGAVPPVVPAPTDLVRVGGKLQIPVDPAEATNGALKTFNTYLRGLDGFPPDSTAGTGFSDAVDSASLPEGVVVYDATTKTLLSATEAVASIDPASANKHLTIATKNRWRNGHTYLVGLFSWKDGDTVHGLRGMDANPVLADSAFAFLRSPTPIYAKCQDSTNPSCACPDLTASACHAVVDGLANAQAQQLEVVRQGLKPLIDEVIGLKGRMRSDLVLAFSFTISQRTFATFDPTRSQVPFPSSLLMSDMGMGSPTADATVKLPILPSDDARTQALKGGLNTLDGFSTTASVQFPIDSATVGGLPVDINDGTVDATSTRLLNLSVPTKQPGYKGVPLRGLLDPVNNVNGFAGQIWLTPSSPLLGDRTTYLAVLTTAIKDTLGQPLLPSPITLLITQSAPLVTAAGNSAVPTIPLAQAQQLEPLRLALAPLVALLKSQGIASSSIAALTAYRTQGIVKPLLTLLGATTQLAPVIPSSVTITSVVPAAAPLGAIVNGTLTVRRVVDLRGPFNTGRLTADPANNDVIPFVMTLPTIGLTPAGGAPVVIVQHGLTRWRGDALAISGTLASKGLAMIAIDVIYHGGRVVCLADADCAAGVTCTHPADVGGVPQAGKCAGAYLAATGATALPGTTDFLPSTNLPNRDFTNLPNPFAQRDNFRQHTLDLFQVVRVIKDATAGGLSALLAANGTLTTINAAKIGYLGQSLGAILGTNFLAMSPSVNLGVLNVGGGDLVDIYSDPMSVLSTGVAAQLGVIAGTPAYFALLESLRWILDPADPINLARYVRAPDPTFMPTRMPAKVILQESGADNVILNPYTLALGNALNLPVDGAGHLLGIDQENMTTMPTVSTFFPGADHGALFDGTAATAKIQLQAAMYLLTGLSGLPTVLP